MFKISSYIRVFKVCSLGLAVMLVASCGSNGSGNLTGDGFEANHGPFDANGNYREDWADTPPTRRPKSKNIAKITKKPQIIAKSTPKAKRGFSLFRSPKRVAAPTPAPIPSPEIVAYNPPPTKTYSAPRKTYTAPKPKYTPKPTPKKVVRKPSPKKITPKSKPPILHTVRKGDTLSALSRKYNTSISLIQRANNISGSTIRIGQKLSIPR